MYLSENRFPFFRHMRIRKTPGLRQGLRLTRDRPSADVESRLTDLEILRGGLAAVGDELVLDNLPLVQAVQPGTLDRRDVHEHVLVAAIWLDEPVAFGRVEPLDGAFLHRRSPGILV